MNITRLGTDQIKGSSYKLPCRLATTGDVNLLSPPTVIDGVTASNNDRILVWKQSTGSQNGIYLVGATWSRAIDFSTEEDIFNGVQVYVTSGATNQTSYILSASGSIVLDATTLSFSSTSTTSISEPSQITITATASITTGTTASNGFGQKGKNVIIDNGSNAINITVDGGTDFVSSYVKHGSGVITFVQGSGRSLIQVDTTNILDGATGSTATIASIGTTDYLRISNA